MRASRLAPATVEQQDDVLEVHDDGAPTQEPQTPADEPAEITMQVSDPPRPALLSALRL